MFSFMKHKLKKYRQYAIINTSYLLLLLESHEIKNQNFVSIRTWIVWKLSIFIYIRKFYASQHIRPWLSASDISCLEENSGGLRRGAHDITSNMGKMSEKTHMHLRESFPRQVDKKSEGPQGERSLEFSRRKKGQTFFSFLYIP